MFYFVIKVIVVSIIISILATYGKLIPRYSKWRYAILQQALNTALLTVVVTILITSSIYPSWIVVFGLVFLNLVIAVQVTRYIAGRGEKQLVPVSGRR